MPSKIRVLNEHVINKIAAGEVIENPASVVKELVENSLDAGATDITIEIQGGGRQLIRVTDNGCGMEADDALLCLERHATSKLQAFEDIHQIATMGFRGEAIPSIAAISKFTLITCPSQKEQGKEPKATLVIVEGGKILKCCEAARSSGTTIEVKSLFFNVPVRKKFQKSPNHDTAEILKTVNLLALGNPTIKFQLISNQKSLLSATGRSQLSFQEALGDRIASVLGADFFSALLPLEANTGNCSLNGFIGVPSYTRHNRTGQHLFINQRPVLSPFISYAVKEGYGTTLGAQRYPVFVLHLNMPGSMVDVNVHPQKREVRLLMEYAIKECVMEGVQRALHQSSKGSLPSLPWDSYPQASLPDFISEENLQQRDSLPLPPLKPVLPEPPLHRPLHPLPQPNLFLNPPVSKQIEIPKVLGVIDNYILIDASTLSGPWNKLSEKARREGGLCVVDQTTAHFRILFEKFLDQINGHPCKTEIQGLLMPLTIELPPLEASLLVAQLPLLNACGISIREFGNHTFLVDGIVRSLEKVDMKSLLLEFIQNLDADFSKEMLKKREERQAILFASRAAISKNYRLSMEEAQALVNDLMKCHTPFHCPKGKPTAICISCHQLAEQFHKGISI